MQSPRFDPDVLQQPFQESEFSSCKVITFQVMTVSGVSPGYPNPVSSIAKGGQNELGVHSGGAGHTDYSEMRWVLKAAHACQIRCTVAAPVAQECGDFRFPVAHASLQNAVIVSSITLFKWLYSSPSPAASRLLQVAGWKKKRNAHSP